MNHPSIEKARVLSGLLVVLASALALTSCGDDVTGPSDLEGGVWRLQSMQTGGAPSFVPPDPARFSVEFKADGQISVVADCNQCGGSYSVSSGTLTVPPMACTLVACQGPEGQQFAAIIDGTSTVNESDDELEIESSEGRLLLRR